MKYPAHLILDFSSSTVKSLSPYWVLVYPHLAKKKLSTKDLYKKYLVKLKVIYFFYK